MINLLKQNQKIWEIFTRLEEYQPFKLDEHQRFLYSLSQQKNILEPVVSKYLITKGLKIDYPNQKNLPFVSPMI
jgi:hypothetical protein